MFRKVAEPFVGENVFFFNHAYKKKRVRVCVITHSIKIDR